MERTGAAVNTGIVIVLTGVDLFSWILKTVTVVGVKRWMYAAGRSKRSEVEIAAHFDLSPHPRQSRRARPRPVVASKLRYAFMYPS